MNANIEDIAKNAKFASLQLQKLSSEQKNKVLADIAETLEANQENIISANEEDLTDARVMLEKGEISEAMFNRLKLDKKKMKTMISGIYDLIKLEDPINKKLLCRQLDEGLKLYKVSCPIGVLGVIFEARPDVITQVSALAIKSSNALIMKGGKEARNTNSIIFKLITNALNNSDAFPKNSINLIFEREDVAKMLKMNDYIDLIIPRGGNSLVKYIKSNTSIPVLGHADGICHIYVDENADLAMAIDIVTDAKTQYPSACNSVETLLINAKFPYTEQLLNALSKSGIELIDNPKQWDCEYSDTILAYKFVENTEEAIFHINTFGSGHTDAIVTDNILEAEKFLNEVDSAGVYHNVSTRFADGYRYGFGAEVGISTNKTHARGPVGLEGLTIYKYKLYGSGQVVKDYAEGIKSFHHKDITD